MLEQAFAVSGSATVAVAGLMAEVVADNTSE